MTSLATPEVPTEAPVPQSTGRIPLADIARAHDVRFLLATFVDMTGKPCAKLVPVEAADELENGAMGFAGYAAGLMGQKPQDSDLIAIPDLASFTPVPFIKEGLAIIHCDPHVDGKPWPYAPRVILKNTLARLAEKGMQAKVGA
jgi:glutamine synthetase